MRNEELNVPGYSPPSRLTRADLEAELSLIKSRGNSSYNRTIDSLEALGEEVHHTTGIFPHNTNLTLIFTAHANANEWSDWTEIIDSATNKLSDAFITDAHLTSFLIEECTTKEKVFMFELSYGDAKTYVTHYRFIAGETTKLPPIQQVRVRAFHVPASEKVYYRMKCEQAGSKTCQLHIRYYLHRE